MPAFGAMKEMYARLDERFEIREYLSDDAERPTILLRERASGKKFVGKVFEADGEGAMAVPDTDYPGVARIGEALEAGRARCLIRPYVGGLPLDGAFKPPCDTDKVISVGISLMRALSAIHGQTRR